MSGIKDAKKKRARRRRKRQIQRILLIIAMVFDPDWIYIPGPSCHPHCCK